MLRTYLKISRPRFWLYLLGPFLIGAVAANQMPGQWFNLVVFGLYFSFPANFLIYGVNDLFDYETDKHNAKKQHYEMLLKPADQRQLIKAIWLWNVPALSLWLLSDLPQAARWGLLGFTLFGIFYSASPIRAKTKPLLDSLFNVLYVCPAIVGYGLVAGRFPPMLLLAAAGLWCMAMHAYSAVPDISADKKAGLHTIATTLGSSGTILFCWLCYTLAVVFSYKWLGTFGIVLGAVYQMLMIISVVDTGRERIFRVYRWFPYINMLVGMALFFWVLAK